MRWWQRMIALVMLSLNVVLLGILVDQRAAKQKENTVQRLRIYTEEVMATEGRPSSGQWLQEQLDKRFGWGSTSYPAVGYWQGDVELSVCVEVLLSDILPHQRKLEELLQELADEYEQKEILLSLEDNVRTWTVTAAEPQEINR